MSRFALFLVCAFASAADKPVVFPRVGVAVVDADVLRAQALKPVLMAADSEQLFFSSQSEVQGCVGQGLFRIALLTGKFFKIEAVALRHDGQLLTEPLCVTRLQVSNATLLVHHIWKTRPQIDRVQGGDLLSLLSEGPDPRNRGVWKWKLHTLRSQSPAIDSATWLAADLTPQRMRLAGYLPDDKVLRYTSIDFKSGDPKERLELLPVPGIPHETISQLDFMGENALVAVSQPADHRSFGTLSIGALNKEGKEASYGGKRPYIQDAVWDEIPIQDWSARRLSAVSVQHNGIYLGDSTTYANEYPLLAYFDFSLQAVLRVQGLHSSWSRQLKAVVPWRKGLLLAYKEPPLIAFVGDKNPFSETISPTRRPDLQEITESDYVNLLEEVKNANRE
jgi:hypothetical protein